MLVVLPAPRLIPVPTALVAAGRDIAPLRPSAYVVATWLMPLILREILGSTRTPLAPREGGLRLFMVTPIVRREIGYCHNSIRAGNEIGGNGVFRVFSN